MRSRLEFTQISNVLTLQDLSNQFGVAFDLGAIVGGALAGIFLVLAGQRFNLKFNKTYVVTS